MLPVTSHLENEAFKKTTKYIKISVHRNISRTRNQFYSKKKQVMTKQMLPFGKISFSSL